MSSVMVHQSRYHLDDLVVAEMADIAKGITGRECIESACPYDHIVVGWWTGMNRDIRTRARITTSRQENVDSP